MRKAKLRTFASLLIVPMIALVATLTASAQQAVPMLVNYQGELKSPKTGDPVPDGVYDMVFEIFTAETRGDSVWQGSYTAANRNPVEVKDGLFSVLLGSETGNKMDAAVFKESDRWLEISIEREMLLPRQRITSAAYSLVSENSRLLGGNEPSQFIIQAQGLRLETNAESPNIIGGHEDNAVTTGVVAATISGGGTSGEANVVTDDYGTIGGGVGHQAGDNAGTTEDAWYATVGGGYWNTASATVATVGGGSSNEAIARSSTVSGGESNIASGFYSTVGGGLRNTTSGRHATVGGGYLNQASADYATISGGGPSDPADGANTNNRVFDDYGTIGGGGYNRAGSDDPDGGLDRYATVSGGYGNTASASSTTVGGGRLNTASQALATVGGGSENTASNGGATVGGGRLNTAFGGDATVSGGLRNTAGHQYATVGGGRYNQANARYATIGGGGPSDPDDASNTNNRVFDDYGTIGGGGYNRAGSDDGDAISGWYTTVSGGEQNAASDEYATVGGGSRNQASADYATVAGGYDNTASGTAATVGGGSGNTASDSWATVPGGVGNDALGRYSFAAGYRAKADHEGAFVWADSQTASIASTAEDSVTFRCLGGVRFTSGSTGSNQQVAWAPGSSSWSFSSDWELKENFVEIDPKEVLERINNVSITEWNFKGYSQRHIGPVAQDFHALFPLGGSNTMIDSGDLQGVSLAAIQGLHRIAQEKDARISTLEERNAELESRVSALEAVVRELAKDRKGGNE